MVSLITAIYTFSKKNTVKVNINPPTKPLFYIQSP